ncbi:ATP-binding cassette domain-containing protein [Rhodobacteraceae bacterium NNCM2]|nr:ATP-binding cassette domain-containing protein [Coraliihabitans acroporae]
MQRKAFDGPDILGEVSFDLAPGEVAALLGPSGCGKTTLLNLIAGLDADFVGRIAPPEGPVAMVFQTPRLLPWRTLAENVALAARVTDAAARTLLKSVGLEDAADQYPEMTSLGMQRRAALARALAVRPGLVLMDEPLVSLDPENAAQMRDLIRTQLSSSGASAVITTHDRHEALSLADRVLELEGTPARLIRDRHSPLGRKERTNPSSVDALYNRWFGTTNAL